MSKPNFVYVTYIASTPQKVWDAITNGEVSKEYWGRHRNASDWKPGSTWKHEDYDDATIVHVVGEVVESVPPRRLVLTWADPAEAGNPANVSRVTILIDPYQENVRVTLIHDEFEPDSEALRGISEGWPLVLSSLKTYLETGVPMPMMAKRLSGPPE